MAWRMKHPCATSVTKPPLPEQVYRGVDNGILTPSDPSIKAEAAAVVTRQPIDIDKQINDLREQMKSDPQKAGIYQAQIDKLEAVRPAAPKPEISEAAAPPTIDQLRKGIDPQAAATEAAAVSQAADIPKRFIRSGTGAARSCRKRPRRIMTMICKQPQDKIDNAENARKKKIAQANFDKMQAENDAHIEKATAVPTPEMEAARDVVNSLEEERMSNAEGLSAARKAAEDTKFTQDEHKIPDDEWSKLKEAGKVQTDENGGEYVRAGDYWNEKETRAKAETEIANLKPEVTPKPLQVSPTGKTPEEQHAAITEDISKKAQAAGIGKEQADAGADLQARAIYGFFGRMFGKSVEEMYAEHKLDFERSSRDYKSRQGWLKNNLVTITNKGNVTTMMHEGAHRFLNLMDKFSKMADAPKALLDEMKTVREWLKLKDEDNLADIGSTRRAHEQFARGFEQYLREGKAPSADLVPIFQKMKNWFNEIYKTVKNITYQGGRFKLTDEARAFFDRTLTEHPETQIEAAEHPASAATHEAEAKNTPVEKAAATADKISSDIFTTAKLDPEVANAIESTKPATGDAAATGAEATPAGTESNTGAANAAEKPAEVATGGNRPAGESEFRSPWAIDETARNERAGAVGFGKSTGSKPVEKLFDKAGNIRLESLTNEEETRAALKEIANKTGLLNHDVISDLEIAELAKALGMKAKDLNIEKLRQLAIEDDLPLAARVRAGREMLLEADKNVREMAAKVENGTAADLANFTDAHNRFLMISETVSAVTNQIGRALRAFQDISGEKAASANQLETLFQQEMNKTSYSMKDLARLVATKTEEQSSAKILQDSVKPGFWDHFAEYRRCSILSGFCHARSLATGTGVNLLYKPIILDTLWRHT